MSKGKVTREEALAYHTGKRHGKVSVVPTKPCLTAARSLDGVHPRRGGAVP